MSAIMKLTLSSKQQVGQSDRDKYTAKRWVREEEMKIEVGDWYYHRVDEECEAYIQMNKIVANVVEVGCYWRHTRHKGKFVYEALTRDTRYSVKKQTEKLETEGWRRVQYAEIAKIFLLNKLVPQSIELYYKDREKAIEADDAIIEDATLMNKLKEWGLLEILNCLRLKARGLLHDI